MRMKAGRLEFYNGDKHIGDMIVIPRPPKSKSMLSAVFGYIFLAIAVICVLLIVGVIFS